MIRTMSELARCTLYFLLPLPLSSTVLELSSTVAGSCPDAYTSHLWQRALGYNLPMRLRERDANEGDSQLIPLWRPLEKYFSTMYMARMSALGVAWVLYIE